MTGPVHYDGSWAAHGLCSCQACEAAARQAASPRLAWIDRLRGLAIALMVLDHALVLVDPTNPLRYTLTRLALPLFMVTAATVHRPVTPRRLLHFAPATAVELLVATPLLGTSPGIVTTYALVAVLFDHAGPLRQRPGLLLTLGLIQALYLPLGITGYQPGLVLAWFALGRLAPTDFAAVAPRHLALLEPLGRHPLPWYVGHLLALAGVHHLALALL